ncbi:hypothetical protein [Bradyrhizobium sp. USDA 4011]
MPLKRKLVPERETQSFTLRAALLDARPAETGGRDHVVEKREALQHTAGKDVIRDLPVFLGTDELFKPRWP